MWLAACVWSWQFQSTPLVLAAEAGHAAAVDALIEGGADADARNKAGQALSGLTRFSFV